MIVIGNSRCQERVLKFDSSHSSFQMDTSFRSSNRTSQINHTAIHHGQYLPEFGKPTSIHPMSRNMSIVYIKHSIVHSAYSASSFSKAWLSFLFGKHFFLTTGPKKLGRGSGIMSYHVTKESSEMSENQKNDLS